MKIIFLTKKEEDILRKSLLSYYETKIYFNNSDISLINKFKLKVIRLFKEKGEI